MGNVCARRRVSHNFVDFEDEWEFVDAHTSAAEDDTMHENIAEAPIAQQQVAASNSAQQHVAVRDRVKRCVRKIIRILSVRKCWSRLGAWLNTAQSNRSRHRRTIARVWNDMTPFIRRQTALFRHLKRQRGRLVYR